jgi:hypothetical protein
MSRRVRRCNDGTERNRGGWACNYKFKPLALNEVQTAADSRALCAVTRLPRTVFGAVDLTAVAATANQHLSGAAGAQEEPRRRLRDPFGAT